MPLLHLWAFVACSRANFIISLRRSSFVAYALLGPLGPISFARDFGKKLSIRYTIFLLTLAQLINYTEYLKVKVEG